MQLYILYGLLTIILVIVLVQDVKTRSIHVILPITTFIVALGINWYSDHLRLNEVLGNLVFIAVNIIGIFIYFSIKNKTIVNPIDRLIGLGDIVFFIALTPLFKFKPFILFFISGLIFSLITYLIVNTVKKTKTIPLAGYLSLFLIVNLFLKFSFNIYFFSF